MEIGLYIAELLGEQDEVSVPGLGTFIKIRVAGLFDESKNVFNPPFHRLAFKEEDITSSGLSQYISNHKNLSVASSEELIKKFVSGIKNSVNNSDTAEIKHLGSIYKENNNLTFRANEGFEVAGSFYGLKPIAEHKNTPPIPLEEEKLQQDEIRLPDFTAQDETQDNDEIEATKARLIPILIISFLAIIATLAALYYFDANFNQLVRNMLASKESSTQIVEPLNNSLNTSVPENLIPSTSDSNMNSKDTLVEKTLSSTEASKTLSRPEQNAKSNENVSYEIIVAAFYKESEAEEYIRNIEAKGLKAKIVENIPGKMHKISMGTFRDEESAAKELLKIKKEINKDAWIARVKPLNNP